MNPKALLIHLSKEGATDEEYIDAGITVRGRGTTCEDGVGLEHDGQRYAFTRVLSSMFLSPSGEEQTQPYIPRYRILPILSGIAIPFCILLDIPGLLTADWYTNAKGSIIISSKPNPPLLVVGITLSTLCIVIANVCLVIRFLERRIKTMTILCTLFLFIHDIINIVALMAFMATKDDYAYYEAFWTTICSTIVSTFTNVTLIVDLIRTPDLMRSGSGLTRKQRSLVIIVIGLFCYVALGAVINSLLLDLTFVDGLYFTVVSIAAIGFGDIVPHNTISRIFVYFYAPLGMINMAFVVGHIRETVLEGLDFGYRDRLLAIQERRRAARRRRRAEKRWRHAIIWRLREGHAPIWIPKEANARETLWSALTSFFWRAERGILSVATRNTHQDHDQHDMQLNLRALSPYQLEASALEAGVPLDTLLPPDFYESCDQDGCNCVASTNHLTLPSWFAIHPVYRRDGHIAEHPTHRRLGAMTAILTRLSLAMYESGGNPLPIGHDGASNSGSSETTLYNSGSLPVSPSEGGDCHADVADTEKKAYYIRSVLGWLGFLIFWMGGAAIFKATEGWTYESSIYFCFTSFSTVGYGDLAPRTVTGRSIFVIWALIGAAIMTGFISVVSEAYASRYRGILDHSSFKHAAQQYREGNKVEFSEKAQHTAISTGTKLILHECEKTDVVEDELPPASVISDDTISVASESTSIRDQHVQHDHWRWALQLGAFEKLSGQTLTEIQSILQYMKLLDNFDGDLPEAEKVVDQPFWSLIDDVMNGRKLTDDAKKDILQDAESRQMLMLLGINRSLRELVNISEQVAAVQEQGRIIASLEQEKEQDVAEISHLTL